jgi:hypothetical protein
MMRIFFSTLWLTLAAGWLSGIGLIANLVGGAKYIAHVGQTRPVAMLAVMGTFCAVAALMLFLKKRLPRFLLIAIAAVAGLHLLNAAGMYILYSTNGHAGPAVMLPFILLASVLPTSTTFWGMPVGNASLLLLPVATFAALICTSSLPSQNASNDAVRKPLLTRSRVVFICSGVALLFAGYLGFLQYFDWKAHRVRAPGEAWTLFERERQARQSSYSEKLEKTCVGNHGRGITRFPDTTVVGIRVLEIKALPEAGARGWESGLAFFLGGEKKPGLPAPATVIEGLQTAVRRIDAERDSALNPEPPFIEYRGLDERWKRYARTSESPVYTEQDAQETRATRGLKIVQLKTGLEASHTIYGGRLEFTDLATGTPAGEHESSAMDEYYGAHNNHALIAAERCSALPHRVDFITNQLAPHFVSDAKKHFVF